MKSSFLALLALAAPVATQQSAVSQEPLIVVDGEAFYSWQDYTSSSTFIEKNLRCRIPTVPDLAPEGPQFRAQTDCSLSNTNILPGFEATGPNVTYQIPVVFHVLHHTNGTGNIGLSKITSQVEVLNEDYNAIAGTNGALGNNAKIFFYLATTDPGGMPTNGVTRHANNTWFSDAGNYTSVAWDTNKYLNIYTNQAGGSLGYAFLPQQGVVGSNIDRVVLLYSAVGRNGSIGPPYNKGRTGTHEVGHWLGLLHTFNGGCAGGDCYQGGDLICDTNEEATPRFGCPGSASSCSTSDPYTNYMDYTDDLCMTNFTLEQVNRMRCTIPNWRPAVHTPVCGVPAFNSMRNAGTNPNVYTATPAILGRDQTYTVTPIAPYTNALVVGYNGAAQQLLPGGQTALVDGASGKLFTLYMPGPSVSIPLPVDVNLCSLTVYTQALLYGGVKPWALTNSVDMFTGKS
jgi:hypothetical protein